MVRRRHVRFALVAVVALVVLGCQPASPPGGDGQPRGVSQAPGASKQRVEVFAWWTTGGEAAGLEKLIAEFNRENPRWEVFNAAVAGGAGSNARTVLKNRMLSGDPPDSFQVHMGRELIDTWVTTGYMEPLDDLYASEGWVDKFPRDVLQIVSAENHYWSVPVNIHRANVLWYNKKVFADAGVQPPTTFDEFRTVAETLRSKGVTPLALGDADKWAATHLFETILLGTLGVEGYEGLWTGRTDWSGPEVTRSLETLRMMLGYVNQDHNALTWDRANQLVIDGAAAMTVMGDWADGDYVAKRFADYGWAPTPGTDGIYLALSDSFGLPRNAKNPDGVKAFLKLLGSAEGQDLFNPLKGSIPARTDAGNPPAGEKGYDDYLKSAMQDWRTDTIAPSLAHGAAASEGWLAAITEAISTFVKNQDVAAAQIELATACETATVCQ